MTSPIQITNLSKSFAKKLSLDQMAVVKGGEVDGFACAGSVLVGIGATFVLGAAVLGSGGTLIIVGAAVLKTASYFNILGACS